MRTSYGHNELTQLWTGAITDVGIAPLEWHTEELRQIAIFYPTFYHHPRIQVVNSDYEAPFPFEVGCIDFGSSIGANLAVETLIRQRQDPAVPFWNIWNINLNDVSRKRNI